MDPPGLEAGRVPPQTIPYRNCQVKSLRLPRAYFPKL